MAGTFQPRKSTRSDTAASPTPFPDISLAEQMRVFGNSHLSRESRASKGASLPVPFSRPAGIAASHRSGMMEAIIAMAWLLTAADWTSRFFPELVGLRVFYQDEVCRSNTNGLRFCWAPTIDLVGPRYWPTASQRICDSDSDGDGEVTVMASSDSHLVIDHTGERAGFADLFGPCW